MADTLGRLFHDYLYLWTSPVARGSAQVDAIELFKQEIDDPLEILT